MGGSINDEIRNEGEKKAADWRQIWEQEEQRDRLMNMEAIRLLRKEDLLSPVEQEEKIRQQIFDHHNKTTELKPTNPKDIIGSDKLPLHLWPSTATALGCLGLLDGALKYGRNNFREIGVRASIYADAAERHLKSWMEGEDLDPDSGLPPLAHLLACIAIIVDAEASGKLNDDRNLAGGWRSWVTKLTPHVARLKKLRASMNPKHYTIKDNHG